MSNKNLNCIAHQCFFYDFRIVIISGIRLTLFRLTIGCSSRHRPQLFAVSVLAAHLLCQTIFHDIHLVTSDKSLLAPSWDRAVTANGDLDHYATDSPDNSAQF